MAPQSPAATSPATAEQGQGQKQDSPEKQSSSPRTPQPPLSPGEAQNVIEADVAAGISDDGYETDTNSASSTSLSSSVRDYVFENNRRYHKFKEGRYLMPNDEPEQEREDMKHAMVVNLCNGRLHAAPLDNPQRIIDIGTGTGIWAIDGTLAAHRSDYSRPPCFVTNTSGVLQLGTSIPRPKSSGMTLVRYSQVGYRQTSVFTLMMSRRIGCMVQTHSISCMPDMYAWPSRIGPVLSGKPTSTWDAAFSWQNVAWAAPLTNFQGNKTRRLDRTSGASIRCAV